MEIQQKVTKDKWEEEFSEGRWESLDKNPLERARHAMIGMFIDYFSPTGRILDVGSGLGTTTDFLDSVQKSAYLGIDISENAVKEAKKLKQAEFKVVEFLNFQGHHEFDVIIFNEVLYYLDEEASIRHAIKLLKDNGLIIVSLYKQEKMHYNDELIWDQCKRYFTTVEGLEIKGSIRDGRNITWRIEVLKKKNTTDEITTVVKRKHKALSSIIGRMKKIIRCLPVIFIDFPIFR